MIDIYVLFAAYFISVISLGISLYCMVRVTEIAELLNMFNRKLYKSNSAYNQYEVKKKNLYKKSTAKGYYDNL